MIRAIRTYVETGTDPRENLATELYLTESVPEGTATLYLWQNRHTVVIGRNQNAWQECRTAELTQSGGFLVRRMSGGGAVYHDLGNLNFTFCVRTEDYDLRKQQRVLLEACRMLGIPPEISGRNDLTVEGRKFSGNSFYSHAGRSFHNGTLLLNVDTARMGDYLNPSRAKLESKGVASVRSRVINLCELMPELTVLQMEQAMTAAFESVYGMSAEALSASEFDAAHLARCRERFFSWDWNYGLNRPCTFSCSERFAWGELTLNLTVTNGLCESVDVYSDAMETDFVPVLSEGLRGCRFSAEALCERIRSLPECAALADDLCVLIHQQAL